MTLEDEKRAGDVTTQQAFDLARPPAPCNVCGRTRHTCPSCGLACTAHPDETCPHCLEPLTLENR